jgi:hypothetical protein
MSDGVIKLSILNFITIGLIAFVFVWLANWLLSMAGVTLPGSTPKA